MTSNIENLKHLQISLEDISLATNDFAEENYIGTGASGKVYKGISEKLGVIAIKRWDHRHGKSSHGDREFKMEIALLSFYKHENIVHFYGFCNEKDEKILVYKYESNGSLYTHLANTDLTWTQRLQICLDAARGLKYLHEDVTNEHKIFHRDVKSANILLDENWKAKISDFGLSRKGPTDTESSFVISNVCGTPGYIDPDYLSTGHLTPKSDVFSFGVVLFEVLCGRPAFLKIGRLFFYVWVQKHYKRKKLDKIIYSNLREQINPASLLTFSTVAYQCLNIGEERPTMKEVVEQLQKALDNQLAPSGPTPSGPTSEVYNDDDFVTFQRYPRHSSGMQITETLKVQMEVQRRLHEQVEVQRQLQLRIEMEGKLSKKIIDEQQRLNGVASESRAAASEENCPEATDPPPIMEKSTKGCGPINNISVDGRHEHLKPDLDSPIGERSMKTQSLSMHEILESSVRPPSQ